MGNEQLNAIMEALKAAGIPAETGFPGKKAVGISKTVAAVDLTGYDNAADQMSFTVRFLTPRNLGLEKCQTDAAKGSSAVVGIGLRGSFDGWSYEETEDCFCVKFAGTMEHCSGETATMKYKVFSWPNQPDSFQIRVIREPEYTVDENGKFQYDGLGPLCREFTGTGSFYGELAYQHFNTLQVLMANGTAGDLVHPIWGTIKAFLTKLELLQDARTDYIAYSYTFREADESGMIPPLPQWQ